MPDINDDFLSNLTPEQRKVFEEYDKSLNEAEAEIDAVPDNKSPSDINRGYTPDSRDAGKQELDGQKITVEEEGKNLQGNEVEKDPLEDYPVKSPLPDSEDKNRNDREMEMDFDRDNC